MQKEMLDFFSQSDFREQCKVFFFFFLLCIHNNDLEDTEDSSWEIHLCHCGTDKFSLHGTLEMTEMHDVTICSPACY